LAHQRLGRLGVVVLLEIDDGNLRAFAREQNADGAADAAVRRR
jgi:hypothetical protein